MKRKNPKGTEFFNASVLLDNLSENEMFKLKGGTSDEDPTMLPEVVVIGHPNEDEPETPPAEDPDPDDFDDEYDDDEDEEWEEPDYWEGDGGENEEPPEEQQENTDCELKYTGLPTGTGANTQFPNQCASTVFNVLNTMNMHSSSLDSVITSIATAEAAKNGTSVIIEKMNIVNNGITPEQSDAYIQANYSAEDINVNYSNIQAAIQDGQAIYAYFDTGVMDGGSSISHAVLICGVNKDGSIDYYDPQLDQYKSTSDFSKFQDAKSISIDQEKSVECK